MNSRTIGGAASSAQNLRHRRFSATGLLGASFLPAWGGQGSHAPKKRRQ